MDLPATAITRGPRRGHSSPTSGLARQPACCSLS
jgi:hypothetical protein